MKEYTTHGSPSESLTYPACHNTSLGIYAIAITFTCNGK